MDELPSYNLLFALFYGGSGKGKTWTCGTAGDRTLYCDVEKRLGTFKTKRFLTKVGKFNPRVISISEEFLPASGASAAVELTKKINEEFDKYLDEFDIVIVDGATAVRRFFMNLGLELNQKTKRSTTLNTKKQISPDFPYVNIEINDWTAEINAMETFIIRMKELCTETRKHFILTAHERTEYNQAPKIGGDKTIRSIKPGFAGQTFPDSTPGLFDLVWRFRTIGSGERVQYFADTEGDGSMLAKSSIGDWPVRLENPNILDIIRRIQNG